ncbi:MAG: thioredoxin family protein [Caldilineaceae bacterium]|nr:thioredoxin family protein [Caldilineaceae bacterium]
MQTDGRISAADSLYDDTPDGTPDGSFDEGGDNLAADKSLAYYAAPTFADYLALVPQRSAALAARLGEIRIAPDEQLFFVTYPDAIRWLAVADDSPATAVVLPVVAHVAALSPRLDLRILGEDEAAAVLVCLTGDPGAAAVLDDADLPLLLAFDEEWQFQTSWGPHPAAIDPYLEQWFEAHPAAESESEEMDEALLAQLTQEMRLWYNSGLNQACAADLRAFLAGMQSAGESDAA